MQAGETGMIGYAFPAGGTDPVMLDICLAYVSGEQLAHMAADGLMSKDEYDRRSRELTERIRARAENVHIPGDASWDSRRELDEKGEIYLSGSLMDRLREYAKRYGVDFLYR